MTRVEIEVNYRKIPGFPLTIEIPIEIRRLDLAFVERGVATQHFDLHEGSYFVTSTLPDGRRLFGQGEVSGPQSTILLSLDPDYDADKPPRRDDDIESPLGIRQITGNIISGDLIPEPGRSVDFRGFYVEGSTSPTIIQVLQQGIPPLNVLLPVYAPEACEVSIRSTKNGSIELEITLLNSDADLLLQYLTNGYLREAATLAKSDNSVFNYTQRDQSWRLIALYTLLRTNEIEELERMLEHYEHWFDPSSASPDNSVIRGETLARLGRHHEAFEAFLELESRGVPVFTDGAFYATQRLKIYSGVLEMRSLKNEISAYTILRRLQRIVAYQISGYPTLAYTGLDLTEPDAVLYSQEIVRETYNLLPLSIGLETLGGVFTRIFERNTPLPASKSEVFSTASDNQTSVEVQVFQGERPMAADNRSLGKFMLSGIPPAPRGVPQIEVAFEVDTSGVLTVSAKDLATGRIQETTFSGAADLARAEVNRVQQQAESFLEFDLHRLKVAESSNKVASIIDQVKKGSARYGVDQGAIRFANLAIAEAENAVQLKDPDAIENAILQLNRALHRLTEQATTTDVGRAGAASGDVDVELDADAEG